MHYVMGDIHNEAKKLNSILEQIQPTCDDDVIVLGDLFDRGGDEADPLGVYFMLSGLQGNYIWIRGNHDQWLADYIKRYFSLDEYKYSIWVNKKENVYLLDCGCGFASGKLACICLESGERFYSCGQYERLANDGNSGSELLQKIKQDADEVEKDKNGENGMLFVMSDMHGCLNEFTKRLHDLFVKRRLGKRTAVRGKII